jgi:amino acid adenylation domain-containing protein/thioester reductase-like protein
MPVAAFPVSAQQRSIWVRDQLATTPAEYAIPAAWRIRGPLDLAALECAFRAVQRRHESLRTRFRLDGKQPVAIVVRDAAISLTLADLSSEPEPLARVEKEIARSLAEPFDLAAAPPVRVRVFRLGLDDHALFVNVHHMVADGESMSILWRELGRAYDSDLSGGDGPRSEPPASYLDYASWQGRWLEEGGADRQLDRRRSSLAGIETHDLPTDRPRPRRRSGNGDSVWFELEGELVGRLAKFGSREGATLFMVFFAAFRILLGRLSSQSDFAIGVPVANRRHADVAELIGCFVNTTAIRIGLSGRETFAELLGRVRDEALDAMDDQDVPWDMVVGALESTRDLSRTPVFQTMFAMHGEPTPLELAGLDVSRHELAAAAAKFDLSLAVLRRAGRWWGRLDFATDILDRATVEAWSRCLRRLLEAIAEDRPGPVSAISFVDPEEAPEAPPGDERKPEVECVHELFVERARADPDAPAVRHGEETVTYGDLLGRACGIAVELGRVGVGRGDVVYLLVEKSPDLVAAMLGAMLAGAAYAALAPADPAQRRADLIGRVAHPVVLSRREMDAVEGATTLFLEDIAPVAEPPAIQVSGRDVAYVVFTSGSSGEPRGVLLEHRAVANLVAHFRHRVGITAEDRMLQFAPPTFDGSVLEIFSALAAGSEIVIAPLGLGVDPVALTALMRENRVSLFDLPPAVVDKLDPGELPDLRVAMVGGEAFGSTLVNAWASPKRPVLNCYGPSEATVIATVSEARERVEWAYPDIGRPIPNVRAYVLDEQLRPVLPRATGTLWIGGVGVARGYLAEPGLTAERFRPDPFTAVPGGRMYDTGDLVRRRADGGIDYLGRADAQLSLRGYRIEPEEVRAAMLDHPGVVGAVVDIWERLDDDRRLVSWYVPADPVSPPSDPDLRAFLADRLPKFMLPNLFVPVEAIPLTRHGKADRTALPEPRPAAPAGNAVVRESETETSVAAAFGAELGLDPGSIDAEADFFELGGHSLLALGVISRLDEELGVRVPVRSFFEEPTIKGLARAVEAADPVEAVERIERVGDGGRIQLSSGQRRLWFLDRLTPASGEYVLGDCWWIRGELDVEALAAAVAGLVGRQEVLRMRFAVADGEPFGVVEPEAKVTIEEVTAGSREEAVALAAESLRIPFDLGRAPLMRARLVVVNPREAVFAIAMHHAISDGASMEVLARELGAGYRAAQEGADAGAEPEIRFRDFAAWQAGRRERSPRIERRLADAVRRLRDAPTLELPVDHARPPVRRGRGHNAEFRIGERTVAALEARGRTEGATSFMTMLAAYAALLGRLTEEEDMTVGVPIAARNRRELAGLVGFFANTIVPRLDLSGRPSFAELLRRVRRAALDVYEEEDVPFEDLVHALAPRREISRTPVFQTLFSLDDVPPPLTLEDLETESVVPPGGAARTDLSCILRRQRDGSIAGRLQYDADLIDAATGRSWARSFETLLGELARDPERPLPELAMVDDAEHRRLVALGEGVARPVRDARIHTIFEEHARARPDAVAVSCGAVHVSYSDLDSRADELAGALVAAGVRRGALVGLSLDRSPDLLVGVLGVLKAGAAFVTLDPAYPDDRLAYVLDDAGVEVVVVDDATAGAPALAKRVRVPVRDAGRAGADRPRAEGSPCDLAYVIYTSGSTGAPKGVAVEHTGIVNLAAAMADRAPLGPGSRVLQFASPSFDAFVAELAESLLLGGTLCVAAREDILPGAPLASTLRRERITFATIPPSILAATDPAALPDLEAIASAGEACPRPVLELWGRGRRFLNIYGPTETAVNATVAELGEESAITIGASLANVTATVRDREGRLVPIGVTGELCIGGVGVARGYLGRPALTAERFVPDPDAPRPGARMYRTGDRVRLGEDGSIRYLGREDGQVKLRGHRIELGEIEDALASHPDVAETVVSVRELEGERRLVAVADRRRPVEARELRRFLATRLPSFMVPHTILTVEGGLPRTPNGKVDRDALPVELDRSAASDRGPAPSHRGLRRAVAEIWAETLDLDGVAAGDSFFELGGDSLSATRATFLLSERLAMEIPVRILFQGPVLADYAAAVERFIADPASVEPPVPVEELIADATPDPSMLPSPARAASAPTATPVLLSGATGFLGAFLLEALLGAGVPEVIALVRARGGAEEAGERLAEALGRRGLGSLVGEPSLRVLPADLAGPRLGLEAEDFDRLQARPLSIVHAAARVDLLAGYRSMAATNVRGTETLLRLACAGEAKSFHHVSTVATLGRAGRDDLPPRLLAADPSLGPRSGYGQSKWVAEQLVLALQRTGLPGGIYRLPRLGPDSRSGVWNRGDLFARVVVAVLRLGCVPDLAWTEELLPVDAAARSIVAGVIGHDGEAAAEPFSITLAEVAEEAVDRGWSLTSVPARDWLELARSSIATAPDTVVHPVLGIVAERLRRTPDPAPAAASAAARASIGGALTWLSREGLIPEPTRRPKGDQP